MADWLVGWLADWLVGSLVDWLVGLLVASKLVGHTYHHCDNNVKAKKILKLKYKAMT